MLLRIARKYLFRFSSDPRFQSLKVNAVTQLREGAKGQ